MSSNKKAGLILMATLYFIAGVNHFIHPGTYYKIIPPYLPDHQLINSVSGALEIIAATFLIFNATRRAGVYLIILLLVAFIPAHVYMIQAGWCLRSGYCFPQWVIWLRLILLQPILIYWAWMYRK